MQRGKLHDFQKVTKGEEIFWNVVLFAIQMSKSFDAFWKWLIGIVFSSDQTCQVLADQFAGMHFYA